MSWVTVVFRRKRRLLLWVGLGVYLYFMVHYIRHYNDGAVPTLARNDLDVDDGIDIGTQPFHFETVDGAIVAPQVPLRPNVHYNKSRLMDKMRGDRRAGLPEMALPKGGGNDEEDGSRHARGTGGGGGGADDVADLLEFRRKRFETYMLSEATRTGAGEQGAAVTLTEKQRARGQKEMDENGFHLFVSDMVALDRSLPDVRDEACKYSSSDAELPTVSVIIIFCNEALSMLLRTVHSVVNRTPPELLKEVLLVDDVSDHDELRDSLDDYIRVTWPDGIVSVLRLSNRSGLIRTRLAGAHAASGDVIAVFDGHVEVTKGWAEPILGVIKDNPYTLVAPSLDYIDTKTLHYIAGNVFSTVKVRWDLGYQWLGLDPSEKHDPRVPIPSEALIGCAFAMDREKFFALGGFDEGMEIWGGENIEIGLRVSMCGGRVVNMPCSRVAHLFRSRKPWSVVSWKIYERNYLRVAEVWMDDYKKYFFKMKPEIKDVDPGDISERLALKERLGCHDFRWFLENVAHKFIYDQNVTAWDRLRVTESGQEKCLDMLGYESTGTRLGTSPCGHNQSPTPQLFALTHEGLLRAEYTCAQYVRSSADVRLERCDGSTKQTWRYEKGTSHLVHIDTGLCLDAQGHTEVKYVTLRKCEDTASQTWQWDNYSPL